MSNEAITPTESELKAAIECVKVASIWKHELSPSILSEIIINHTRHEGMTAQELANQVAQLRARLERAEKVCDEVGKAMCVFTLDDVRRAYEEWEKSK